MCKESNIFNINKKVAFRVLVTLRISTKNRNSDTLNKLSVGASTDNMIFRTFVVTFFARFYFYMSK